MTVKDTNFTIDSNLSYISVNAPFFMSSLLESLRRLSSPTCLCLGEYTSVALSLGSYVFQAL